MNKGKKVFVGLSGGVDSSVAALRLKKAGFDVYGVFIKVWHPDWLKCNWEEERLDAMRVAAKLDIPFLTCDAEEAYKKEVADYFISEYQAGETPNPDVMCNKAVKFGRFLEFAESYGADFVATGHYARVVKEADHYQLKRGLDTNKDQSYFLWTLTQKQLAKILFPVGNSTKEQIRREAKEVNLITATKKDSQGICFLGHIDIAEFLGHYIDLKPGHVLNQKGEVIGTHQGSLIYTTGQRHGFTTDTTYTNGQPQYVISRNLLNNTITVSDEKPITVQKHKLLLKSVNLITEDKNLLDNVFIQTRYRQKPTAAKVEHLEPDRLTLSLLSEAESFSTGQSCVLYQQEVCLGGGIIAE